MRIDDLREGPMGEAHGLGVGAIGGVGAVFGGDEIVAAFIPLHVEAEGESLAGEGGVGRHIDGQRLIELSAARRVGVVDGPHERRKLACARSGSWVDAEPLGRIGIDVEHGEVVRGDEGHVVTTRPQKVTVALIASVDVAVAARLGALEPAQGIGNTLGRHRLVVGRYRRLDIRIARYRGSGGIRPSGQRRPSKGERKERHQ